MPRPAWLAACAVLMAAAAPARATAPVISAPNPSPVPAPSPSGPAPAQRPAPPPAGAPPSAAPAAPTASAPAAAKPSPTGSLGSAGVHPPPARPPAAAPPSATPAASPTPATGTPSPAPIPNATELSAEDLELLAALLHMDLKTQEQAVRDIAANLGPAALESMLNSARQANTPAPAPAPADEPRSADNVPLSERLKQPLVLYAMGVSAVAVLLVTLVILKPEERIGEEAAKRWRQLMKYAPIVQRAQKSLPVRVVMACMQLLPVVDIITDVLSLAHYVLSAWYAWAATCAVILFYNWRFSLLFAVLHPKPSARKLGLLYMPGLLLYGWSELTTPDEDEESTIEPSVDESVVQSQRGGGMERSDTRNTRTGDPGGGGVFGSLFGSKRGVAEDAQQPSTGKKPVVLLGRVPTSASARGAAPTAGPNPGFGGRLFGKQGSRSGLTEAAVAKASQKESAAARRARKAQEAVQQMLMDNDKAIASRIFRLLDAEVKKAPKAMGPGRVLAGLKIEAIVSALAVPVGLFIIARASLMLAEAKLFRFRGDRAVEAKRRVLYNKVLTFVEALFESLPQLALQTWVFLELHGNSRVYRVSAVMSSLGVLKATATFVTDRRKILQVLGPPKPPAEDEESEGEESSLFEIEEESDDEEEKKSAPTASRKPATASRPVPKSGQSSDDDDDSSDDDSDSSDDWSDLDEFGLPAKTNTTAGQMAVLRARNAAAPSVRGRAPPKRAPSEASSTTSGAFAPFATSAKRASGATASASASRRQPGASAAFQAMV